MTRQACLMSGTVGQVKFEVYEVGSLKFEGR